MIRSARTWVTDGVHSVVIDLGDPSSSYGAEPSPNGSRLNTGAYGDHPEASQSRTNAWLTALTFNDGGQLSGADNPLHWTYGGFSNGALVRIEYSTNLGANWTLVQGGLPVTNGVYVWDTSSLPASAAYWRVVSEDDSKCLGSQRSAGWG